MLEATERSVMGLGLTSWELDEGDLTRCGGTPTGSPCRGFAAGGIIEFCRCINLSDPATTADVKLALMRATGSAMSSGAIWTEDDEAVLLGWVEETAGLYLPDVRRPWLSGYVTASSLAHRTESGFAYPSARGILALLDHCIGEGFSGCEAYAALNAAVGQLGVGVAPIDALVVYPPIFGAPGGGPAPARQEPLPPEDERPEEEREPERASVIGWVFLGAVAVVAGYWIMR